MNPDIAGVSLPSRAIKTRNSAERGGKKGHSYRPLPVQFRRDGFNYRQIAREGAGIEIVGKFIEPHEVYPNSETWGVDGFTLTDKDAAFAKLKEVTG